MGTDLRLIHCGQVPPQGNWGMARHTHTFHEIIVVFRGHLTVVFDSETIEATTGDILFYKAGRFHAEQSDPMDKKSLFWWYGHTPVETARNHP